MNNNETRIPLEVEAGIPKITLDELAIDVSAFLHFLSEQYEGDSPSSELPSFWMLIPKSLDVEWREGTKEFYIEKEVFSRKLVIVAQPVPDAEKQNRRADLLMMFHNAVAEDQMKQILLLLSRLREESRQAMIEKFHQFRASHPTRTAR